MKWAIAIMFCVLAAPSFAVLRTDVGVLTCTLAEGEAKGTEPESQTRAMLCSFKPKGEGPEESYLGEIKNVGSQTELSGKLVLIWAVMGPSERKLKPAVLQQTFVGEVAENATDKSKMPKLLVGARDKAYGLQPITDEHEPDTSDSVTVVELRIKSTAS